MQMKTPEPENRVCDQCGAPLRRHLREGLCTRCVARFSLLEEDEEDYKVESRKQKLTGRKQRTEDGGLRSEVGSRVRNQRSKPGLAITNYWRRLPMAGWGWFLGPGRSA